MGIFTNVEQLIVWESTSKDTIDLKRLYVDVAGDLVTGVLLSQLMYWFLPDRSGNSRLRVYRDDKLWLVKARTDWWEECRITPKQFDRSISILKELNLVETSNHRFHALRTMHIWLNLEELLQRVNSVFTKGEDRKIEDYEEESVFPDVEEQDSPEVNSGVDETGRPEVDERLTPYGLPERVTPLTETTTEITSETTSEITTEITHENDSIKFFNLIISKITEQLSRSNQRWYEGARLLNFDQEQIVIGVKNQQSKSYIENYHSGLVSNAVYKVIKTSRKVVIEVVPSREYVESIMS